LSDGQRPPQPPAGWYDDAAMIGLKRYWDGSSWTGETLPSAQVPGPRPQRGPALVIVTIASVVLAAGALVFAFTRPPTVVEIEPTATPEQTAEPTVPAGDYADFVEDATRDLGDMDKDLDDMDTTLDEGGYWRLLSNQVELQANLQQLRGADAPDVVADDWDDLLDTLGVEVGDIGDVIGEKEGAVRDAVAEARAAVAEARALVELVAAASTD